MKRNVIFAVILMLALSSIASAQNFTGKVLAVEGSDRISVANGDNTVTVRLNCVAAPAPGQTFEAEALQFLQNMMMGKDAYVQVIWQDSDSRQVSRVSVNDKDVAVALAGAGFGWYDDRNRKDAQVEAAQLDAQGKKAGIWSNPNPEAPWDFLRRQRGIIPTSGAPINVGGGGYGAPAASSGGGTSVLDNAPPVGTAAYFGDTYYGGAYYYPGANGVYPNRGVVNSQSVRGAASRGGGVSRGGGRR